jgi:hypothetical protein
MSAIRTAEKRELAESQHGQCEGPSVRLVTSMQEETRTPPRVLRGLVPGSSSRKGIVMVSTREIAACVSGQPKKMARAWMGCGQDCGALIIGSGEAKFRFLFP